MKVRQVQSSNRTFEHNGGFGIYVPLIDPEITVIARFESMGNPPVLNTSVRIEGKAGGGSFVYENEENIELENEDLPTVNDLLKEVKNSVNRCFNESHDACIRKALLFPFPFEVLNPDLKEVKEILEEDLKY